MSEPMFPSGNGDAAPVAAEPQPSGGSRKALLAIGGAVGALVVGAGAFLLLTGSGSGGDTPSAASAPQTVAAAPAPAPSSTPLTTIKTVSVTARDPFAPLFPSPKPTPAAAAPATVTPAQGPTAAPAGPKVTLSVSVVNPTAQTATVSVDGVKYPVTIGKVFAKTFVLYSVFNGQCVGILYGDQSVPVCTTSPATVSP